MRPLLFVLIALFFAMPDHALSGTSRDLKGQTLKVTSWHPIAAHEIRVNIGDLPGVVPARVQQRIRNNRSLQQRIDFDGEYSQLWLEIVDRPYSSRTVDYINKVKSLKKIVEKQFVKKDLYPYYLATKKLFRQGAPNGYMLLVSTDPDDSPTPAPGKCIYAMIGFLGDPLKSDSSRSGESYDTSVEFRDCSGKRTLDEIEQFLAALTIVPPEYNRARMTQN